VFTRLNTTAGTIGAATSVDGITSMAAYNGNLYFGITEPNAARVFRYNGGGSGTADVFTSINPTAGTIDDTAVNTDRIESMAVVNDTLYVGTAEADDAMVARYNGGEGGDFQFSSMNGGSNGNIGGNGLVDEILTLTSYNGTLIAGTLESAEAEVYQFSENFGLSNSLNFQAASTTPYKTITATHIETSRNNADQSSYTTSVSFTPAANKLYLLSTYSSIAAGTINNATVTGNSMTWEQVHQETSGTTARMELFRAMSSTGGTNGTLTIDYSGQTQQLVTWTITEFDGVNTSGTNGEGATMTFGCSAAGSSTSVSWANGLPNLRNQKQASWGAFVSRTNNTTFAASGGFTELGAESAGTAPVSTLGSVFGTNLNAPSGTFGANTNASSCVAILNPATETTLQSGFLNQASISFSANLQGSNNIGAGGTGSFLFTHGIMTTTGAYDLAEDYPTRDDSLKAGELVSIDPSEYGFVKKTASANDSTVVGVYSTNPGFRLSQQDATINGGRAVPIALAGRVPVKVTNEGGAIVPGDYLTSSSTPGYAKKATEAGPVIGKALASFDAATGNVLAFVNISYYNPAGAQAMQGSDPMDFASLNVTGEATISSLTVTGSAKFAGNIIVGGHIITSGETPVVEVDEASGAGATATIEGNDTAGQVTLTAGTSAAGGKVLKVTFNKPFAKNPAVQLTAANDASAQLKYYVETTADGFEVVFVESPQAGTSYKLNYWTVEY
jgi:hypothetical protein